MLVAYPTNMPIPLVTGYSLIDAAKIQHSDVADGFTDFDLLSEHSFFTVKASWNLSQSEFQVFEGWFKHELTFGAKAFNMSVKMGTGLQLSEFYLNKKYLSSLNGKRWKVTAGLLGVDRDYDSLAAYTALKEALAQSISMVECGEALAACGESFAESGNRTT